MKQSRTKRIYDLHAWTGVTCGLFVFIVSLSGIFALFGDELHSWEDPQLRITLKGEPLPAMPLLGGFAEEAETRGKLQSLSLNLPTPKEPYYAAFAWVRPEGARSSELISRRWHPYTGKVLAERGDGFVHWLVDFHRNLMLERTLGRALVGLGGVLLLLSILSGVVTHRKILREMFTWRLDRSVRLKWQDSHKAIGVWGLPFHIMIAFTGAWLGLIVVLLPIVAMISFKGDQGAVIAAVTGPQVQAAGVRAEMYSIDTAASEVADRIGAKPESVRFLHWGDANGEYRFLYRPKGVLIDQSPVVVKAVSGEILKPELTSQPGISHRVLAAMTTLHYALFAGLWMKFLYALLGLLLSIVTATGLMMWLERRVHGNEGRSPPIVYTALARTTVGVCAGMGLASFAIFHADKLLNVYPEGRMAAVGTAYFGVWAAALVYAWLRGSEYMACKELLGTTGIVAASIPLTNAFVTGASIPQLLAEGHSYAAGTDITCAISGACLLLIAWTLPSRRPAGRRVAAVDA